MSLMTTATRMWLTRSTRPFVFTTKTMPLSCEHARGLGLYIHIPFCRNLCSFCPYCKVKYDEKLADVYVDALCREIDLVGRQVGRRRVGTLYFGGGSPALVARHFPRIMQVVRRWFVITQGVGVELHPADVNVPTLDTLRSAGVTRISIGIQSFQPEYLQLLGRKHHDCEPMFQALAQVPFETVAMDFIFALPGQTLELLRKDIDTAFARGANYVAIYPFIDFSYTRRDFPAMQEGDKRRLLANIVEHCKQQGYVRDSIWTFGRPGTKKYSSMTRANYLGFGCSATTLLPDQFKINTFSVPHYIRRMERGKLPTALTLPFTQRQRMVYDLFWTAYTMQVDGKEFYRRFGRRLEECYGAELWLAQRAGLVRRRGNVYEMTDRGAYAFYRQEQHYTLSYIDRMWGLMRRKPFPDQLVIS